MTASYRCTTCNTNWPSHNDFANCPRCGSATWVSKGDKPDHTYTESIAMKKAAQADVEANATLELPTVAPEDDSPRGYRVTRFLELGFPTVEANLLADAKSHGFTTKAGRALTWSTPVHHRRVAQMLADGATHEQVMAIYV